MMSHMREGGDMRLLWWLLVVFAGLFFTVAGYWATEMQSEARADRLQGQMREVRISVVENNQALISRHLDAMDQKMDRLLEMHLK